MNGLIHGYNSQKKKKDSKIFLTLFFVNNIYLK